MEDDLKRKIACRGYVKGTITRLFNFVESSDLRETCNNELVTKRDRLINSFREYESLCKEILYLDNADKENVEQVENNYYYILASLNEQIKSHESVSPSGSSKHSDTTHRTKLPPISIKTFDGKFTEYIPFINLFDSLIHNDGSLDHIQKLYYLRSYLQGEPYDLIKNLTLTSESYSEARKLLKNRYDNKYKIINDHICNVLDLQSIVKSSASNLRDFVSSVRQQLAAIKNLDPNIIYWDAILLCILSRKLDGITARAYQLDRDTSQPNLEDFLQYLDKRALALENAGQGLYSQQQSTKVAAVATTGATCIFCKSNDHKLYNCKKFQLLPAEARLKFAKEQKLCLICLGMHAGKCRFHFRCSECKKPHNTLLHCNSSETTPAVTLSGNVNNNVLLPTVRIKVVAKNGTQYIIKALLDSGSQVSFITAKVVQQLGLTPLQSNTCIVGITNEKSNVKYNIPIEIHSLRSPFKTTVNCHVVKEVTCKLPQNKFDVSSVIIPPNITLADDQFNVPSEIHMLLGANVFFQTLLPSEQCMSINLPKQSPALPRDAALPSQQPSNAQLHIFNTHFGHIIGGNLPPKVLSQTCNKVVLKCEQGLNETLAQFWTNEKVPEIFTEQTSEQELCEQIFQSSVKLIKRQFEVPLPLKLPLSDVNDTLGESFHFALKRFLNLEKRLHADPDLFMQYKNFIHEYLALGHGHYIDIELYDLNKHAVYFLPHHAVINNNSKSTRLRTVFDGSMKTNKKVSLNDLQLNGPVVQKELFDIILLFRLGRYTFTADIKRMFRNIKVDPQFTSLQNILWRDNPDDAVKCIRLDTVTYGLKSSSYLATRCLDELANRYEKSYPLASSIIKNNVYVDDIIYCDNNLETTITAREQLRELLELGSFHTHKWSSNDKNVLNSIPLNERHFDSLELQKDECNMKALGLRINVKDDHFIISSPEPFNSTTVTKRSILSYIGRFYDPMGFVSPIVVTAKSIMQKLWILNTGWNDSPPANVQQEWHQFTSNLAAMQPILLDRNIKISEADSADLIGFADASSKTAYGCCVYLRCTNQSGTTKLHLLCSKSRINPIQKKGMTVPRLELNAALLLSKLILRTLNTLRVKINIRRVCLFCDSQIVLAWLNTELTKLQAYVSNRVNVIRQNTAGCSWHYVNTKDNPADLISRGVNPNELSSCNIWWNGPEFLQNSEYSFPAYSSPIDLVAMEPCLTLSSNLVCQNSNPLDYVLERLYNYSNINKIVRLLAYILRFLNNINKNKVKINTNFLQSSELNNALMLIIKHEQNIYFKSEIKALSNNNNLKGNLSELHPFLDDQGLLRVGGRLHYADIPYSQKHAIILPKASLITSLLIRCEHERLLHAGPQLLLSHLNQRFWIVNGLLEVKKVTHKCIVCFRQKATVAKQLMGSLPAARVTATSRPFEKVGVDFAGPIEVKLSRVRRSLKGKGYICVFVCFATKAVHLELASDLTTDTFLACLRRFISRRGLPTEIHCDNASTFKCARNQLVELHKLHTSQSHQMQIHKFTAERGIQFHFIPCYSPTFGGLWEAAVKSTKFHLKRILQSTVLTYEQLNTVLIEIEAVLNSRPLLPLSSNTDDYCYLTPGHFIIGNAMSMYPENNVCNIPQNRLKFWQLCTSLKQSFWKVWHQYYLNLLQNRPKWRDNISNVKLGNLVILKEDNTPPMSWPMARIVKLFPGHDGKIRAVEVRTSNGKIHSRAINKICLLPIDYDDSS